MRKRTIVTILVSISALLLFSGLLYAQDYEVIVMDRRQVIKTYDFEKNGDIYVKNVTGDIRISGWNQNKIDIDIQRRGRRDDIEVIIDRRGKSFYIEVDYPDIDYRWDNDRNSGSVHFTIKVPEETELDIENATGDIIVTGINARVEASTATGDVELSKIKGEVYGKTATGSVEVYDVDGSVDAHSATGRIRVRSTGDVDANSATGTIDIFSSNARNLEASVATGRVDVELENVHPSGRYELKSSMGSVTLTIPGDAKADFIVKVKPDNLDSDFDIFREDIQRYERKRRRSDFGFDFSPRTFEGELNGGGARIYLSTSQGDIDIRRR